MIALKPLTGGQAGRIAAWCENRTEDFLRQWAGRGYTFPLTRGQMEARLAAGATIFAATQAEHLIGTIELTSIDLAAGMANAGRFLVDPAAAGHGFGTEILKALMAYCRTTLHLKTLTLCVFDFNIPARRCYEKCGFFETGRTLRPNGWVAIDMRVSL